MGSCIRFCVRKEYKLFSICVKYRKVERRNVDIFGVIRFFWSGRRI